MPPHITKRRTITNLKTKNNQNCQKIELYGSPTTKELKKKHSSRLVGGTEMGGQGKNDGQQGSSWRTRVGKAAAGRQGSSWWTWQQTLQPRVPAQGNKASKPLTENICGGCGSGRNSQSHRRILWRDPQGPRGYTNPPTWESAPEGPNLLVGNGGSD